jgi:hypothetical protein
VDKDKNFHILKRLIMSITADLFSAAGKIIEASKDISTEKLAVLGMILVGSLAVMSAAKSGNS